MKRPNEKKKQGMTVSNQLVLQNICKVKIKYPMQK